MKLVHSPERKRCLLCRRSTESRVLFQRSAPILQCRECGLVFADATDPSAHDYSEDYYRRGAYANYLKDQDAILRNSVRMLAHLGGLTRGRSLLDIGCATGVFLEAARGSGWTVRGLEMSEYAAEHARRERGLSVHTGSIESPPSGLPKFDAITLWDTIEHLGRPDSALSAIHDLLLPDGVLALSTGDYGSLLRRLTGRRWRLFADPTHRFFFDARTLKRLLSQSEFEILGMSRHGKYVSLLMILHQLNLPLAHTLRDRLDDAGWNPAIYVNLRDVMTVYARPL